VTAKFFFLASPSLSLRVMCRRFALQARCTGMKRLDARHYRDEAQKCREAAARAKDSSTREHWLEAERCWIELANKAELVATFNAVAKKPTDAFGKV
jgi:hypothetical protein